MGSVGSQAMAFVAKSPNNISEANITPGRGLAITGRRLTTEFAAIPGPAAGGNAAPDICNRPDPAPGTHPGVGGCLLAPLGRRDFEEKSWVLITTFIFSISGLTARRRRQHIRLFSSRMIQRRSFSYCKRSSTDSTSAQHCQVKRSGIKRCTKRALESLTVAFITLPVLITKPAAAEEKLHARINACTCAIRLSI